MDRSDVLWFVLHVTVVAVVVFAVLSVVVFDVPLTGFLAFDRNVTVSIQETEDTEITRFEFDQVLTIGNSTFVSVELANRGSVPVQTTYNVEVYNINNSLLYTYPGPDRTLQPGSILGRTVKHTPHETGTYIVRLRAEAGSNILQSAKFLLVKDEPVPPEPGTFTVTRRRIRYIMGPKPDPIEPPSHSWQVDAPRTLEMGQNATTTLPIRITNTGEATERNIRLTVQNTGNISVSYEPKIIFALPSNTTRSFLLTVRSGRTRQDQEISYSVASEDLGFNGGTAVSIVPTATIAQLRGEIEKLRALIGDAEAEMTAMERNGIDVSEQRSDLADVKQLVTTAETAIAEENLAEARQQIDAARTDMSDLFRTLFKLQSERVVVRAPLVQPVYLLIAASILIAVLMVGGYYYLRERHEERPKLLRDIEEEVEV